MQALGPRNRSSSSSAVYLGFCLPLAGLLAGCSGEQGADGGASDETAQTTSNASQPQETSSPPWPAPSDVLVRAKEAGLDLGPMGMAEHYHPQLRVTVDGGEVGVPANIGVDPATGAMTALHTHTADGVLHVEADTAGQVFTLGQLFTQWGVKLSPEQIGGVHAKAGETVTVTSNGSPYRGDPAELPLQPDQQIVISVE